VRLTITYDVLKGTDWVEETVELPVATADTTAYSLNHPIYSQVVPSPATRQLDVTYLNGFLQNIIKDVTTVKYKNNRLVYKWIVFTVLQFERNLYNYYKAVREYRDPRSIRLDRPLYSEIDGGIGFVGAYSADSLVYLLPTNFGGNR
jgi:hypothetical protein